MSLNSRPFSTCDGDEDDRDGDDDDDNNRVTISYAGGLMDNHWFRGIATVIIV